MLIHCEYVYLQGQFSSFKNVYEVNEFHDGLKFSSSSRKNQRNFDFLSKVTFYAWSLSYFNKYFYHVFQILYLVPFCYMLRICLFYIIKDIFGLVCNYLLLQQSIFWVAFLNCHINENSHFF